MILLINTAVKTSNPTERDLTTKCYVRFKNSVQRDVFVFIINKVNAQYSLGRVSYYCEVIYPFFSLPLVFVFCFLIPLSSCFLFNIFISYSFFCPFISFLLFFWLSSSVFLSFSFFLFFPCFIVSSFPASYLFPCLFFFSFVLFVLLPSFFRPINFEHYSLVQRLHQTTFT
jgi:hypothetical protein